jgi:hypothetical protein
MVKTRYTAEELMNMNPEELDGFLGTLVIGGRPAPEMVRCIHEGWLRLSKSEETAHDAPEYSRSSAGMCFIFETMRRKGFSPEVGPDDSQWFSKEGKEYPRTPWAGNILKSTAIAAVLAVQGE